VSVTLTYTAHLNIKKQAFSLRPKTPHWYNRDLPKAAQERCNEHNKELKVLTQTQNSRSPTEHHTTHGTKTINPQRSHCVHTATQSSTAALTRWQGACVSFKSHFVVGANKLLDKLAALQVIASGSESPVLWSLSDTLSFQQQSSNVSMSLLLSMTCHFSLSRLCTSVCVSVCVSVCAVGYRSASVSLSCGAQHSCSHCSCLILPHTLPLCLVLGWILFQPVWYLSEDVRYNYGWHTQPKKLPLTLCHFMNRLVNMIQRSHQTHIALHFGHFLSEDRLDGLGHLSIQTASSFLLPLLPVSFLQHKTHLQQQKPNYCSFREAAQLHLVLWRNH